jgi:olefin beta-lactone synthetase
VATIGSREVLEATASLTRAGKGTCVGRLFDDVEAKIIRMSDGPIERLSLAVEMPVGEIGEIIVSGLSVTREYFQHLEANHFGKILDDVPAKASSHRPSLWHRIGDVGYSDEERRLWFCGRKAHVVHAADGPMYSVCCEAIFDEHPRVYRSALIGLGRKAPFVPAIVVEPEPGCLPATADERQRFTDELLALGAQRSHTAGIRRVFFHPSFPVDTRHNVKINREALREWAQHQPNQST